MLQELPSRQSKSIASCFPSRLECLLVWVFKWKWKWCSRQKKPYCTSHLSSLQEWYTETPSAWRARNCQSLLFQSLALPNINCKPSDRLRRRQDPNIDSRLPRTDAHPPSFPPFRFWSRFCAVCQKTTPARLLRKWWLQKLREGRCEVKAPWHEELSWERPEDLL